MKQNMADKKKEKPFVLVLCMTYNHEKYIENALNGFVMQKTNFPFVVAVIDDASTDNNAQVIIDYLQRVCDADAINSSTEEYGKVIDAIPSTNSNCLLHVVLLNENHYGKKSKRPYYAQYEDNAKYISMCEGDDYWTDPYKLQKQVDFMNEHPDYSMCFHKAKVLSDVEEERTLYTQLEERECSAYEIYKEWLVPTCSVVYRVGLLPIENSTPPMVFGDIYMFLRLAEKGKLYHLNFVGAVYRRNSGGVSQKGNVSLYIKLLKQYEYMEKRFPQPELVEVSRELQDMYLKCIISSAYFPDRWKYRMQYMRRHPRLFISKFGLVTLWQMFHKPKNK